MLHPEHSGATSLIDYSFVAKFGKEIIGDRSPYQNFRISTDRRSCRW
jgi:hypothetical protein